MQTEYYITIDDFCANYNVEPSFINSLQENGLIEIERINESRLINAEQLRELEKIVSLFYDLDINLEGIETINHLLERIKEMHTEIIALRNRLRLYEADEKFIHNLNKTRKDENSH
ncbi:MAG: hypothetical protein A2X18_01270 [Bacteroidetes bacterium GWF2_40_14]|nr:MAG: hypothetical protein A2X18_01270 [Bacteroidetes bacterium GWF2_40_14]